MDCKNIIIIFILACVSIHQIETMKVVPYKSLLLRKLSLQDAVDENGSHLPRIKRFFDPRCDNDYGTYNNENDDTRDKYLCAFGNYGFSRKRSTRNKRLGWGNRAMQHGRKRSSLGDYLNLLDSGRP